MTKRLKKKVKEKFIDICNHVKIKYKALSYYSGATWERALYNSRLLIFPKHYDNIKMFSSAFLSQKLSMVFLIFGQTKKQKNIFHVFYLVAPHEIKSCEK